MRCPSPNLSLSSYKIKIKEQRKIYVYKWEKLYCCSINWIATGIFIKTRIQNTGMGLFVELHFCLHIKMVLLKKGTCVTKSLWPASSNFLTYFSQRDTNYTKKRRALMIMISTPDKYYIYVAWKYIRIIEDFLDL